MKKVLVTGAGGFIGSALVQMLRSLDVEIIGTARRKNSAIQEIAVLSPETDWSSLLLGCDTVVHLAARVNPAKENSIESLKAFRRINVEGTLNLARQAQQAGIVRFVFISTVKVLGEGQDHPYTENDAPAPVDEYAISKWEAERGLLEFSRARTMEIVIIRPPMVYGPGTKGNFASLVRLMKRGLPLPLRSIDNRRSLVNLSNLLDFIVLCADRKRSPNASNQIFLISDGKDVSTPELLRAIASAHHVEAKLFHFPVGLLRAAAKLFGHSNAFNKLAGSLTVDTSKALNKLGWKPILTLEEQLNRIADDVANS